MQAPSWAFPAIQIILTRGNVTGPGVAQHQGKTAMRTTEFNAKCVIHSNNYSVNVGFSSDERLD
jgi:hypothetical protein